MRNLKFEAVKEWAKKRGVNVERRMEKHDGRQYRYEVWTTGAVVESCENLWDVMVCVNSWQE